MKKLKYTKIWYHDGFVILHLLHPQIILVNYRPPPGSSLPSSPARMTAARLGLLVGVACFVAKVSPGQAINLYREDTSGFSRSQETPQVELDVQDVHDEKILDHRASKRWGSRLGLPRSLRTSATHIPFPFPAG